MYTSHLMPKYSSTLLIGSLHSNHSGVHRCSSVMHPLYSSIFVVDSAIEQTAYIGVEIGRMCLCTSVLLINFYDILSSYQGDHRD